MAKAVLDKLEDAPEALRSEYKQGADGRWTLQLEGDHPAVAAVIADANVKVAESAAKVAEFRSNNVALLKALGADSFDGAVAKLEALKALDPEKYRAMEQKIADLEKRGVKNGDDVTSLVQKALKEYVDPLRAELDAEKKARSEADARVRREGLKSLLVSAGLKAGVREEAIPDYLGRGLSLAGQEGERVVFKDEAGAARYSKKRPGELMDVMEWAESLQAEAPHLYKPSKGAGTDPGSAGGPAPKGTYDANDPKDFLANVDKIAKGEVVRAQ